MYDILLINEDVPGGHMVDQMLADKRIVFSSCRMQDLHPEYVLKKPLDLIIFEVYREEMSCVAIFKQLEKWMNTSGEDRPPVIVITTQRSTLTERSARIAGADFFFIKPVDSRELIAAVEQSLKMSYSHRLCTHNDVV